MVVTSIHMNRSKWESEGCSIGTQWRVHSMGVHEKEGFFCLHVTNEYMSQFGSLHSLRTEPIFYTLEASNLWKTSISLGVPTTFTEKNRAMGSGYSRLTMAKLYQTSCPEYCSKVTVTSAPRKFPVSAADYAVFFLMTYFCKVKFFSICYDKEHKISVKQEMTVVVFNPVPNLRSCAMLIRCTHPISK